MFGLVTANLPELSAEEKDRYTGVYCGICRRIKAQSSNLCRLGLRYDMAFLSLLLMSLYELEEEHGDRACKLHPLKPRPWTDCDAIRYAADMNVALAFYKFRDDRQDDKTLPPAGWRGSSPLTRRPSPSAIPASAPPSGIVSKNWTGWKKRIAPIPMPPPTASVG